MIGSSVGMIQTGWLPAIFVFGTLNGLAWAFFPILITVPFNLRGIQPRELAVAFSFTMMLISFGIGVGPLITGYLQELTGDLKLALFVMCFIPVTLIVAGSTLSFGRGAGPDPGLGSGAGRLARQRPAVSIDRYRHRHRRRPPLDQRSVLFQGSEFFG